MKDWWGVGVYFDSCTLSKVSSWARQTGKIGLCRCVCCSCPRTHALRNSGGPSRWMFTSSLSTQCSCVCVWVRERESAKRSTSYRAAKHYKQGYIHSKDNFAAWQNSISDSTKLATSLQTWSSESWTTQRIHFCFILPSFHRLSTHTALAEKLLAEYSKLVAQWKESRLQKLTAKACDVTVNIGLATLYQD